VTFTAGAGIAGSFDNAILEIDLGQCKHTYGQSPCTAGGSAGAECYNGRANCQDAANYDESGNVITPRFSMGDRLHVDGVEAFPCIKRINVAPTKLNPAKGLSSRELLTVTLLDFTDNDALTDPYFATRNIATSGTFFGKLFARFPYYKGRAMRLKLGFAPSDGSDATIGNFDKTLNFIIDEIVGPDDNGQVTIKGKDILSLTDALKSEIPATSTGTLSAAINATTGAIPLQAGEGADYLAATGDSGIILVNDELILCTGRSGDSLTVAASGRGYANTTAAEHDSGDDVQLCFDRGFRSATDRVDEILRDILQDYGGIDSSAVPFSEWSAHVDIWGSNYYLKNIISDPISVKEALEQITLETGFDVWYDNEAAQIKLQANVPETGTLTVIDDSQLGERASVKRLDKERVSRATFYFGVRDYLGDFDRINNFSNRETRIDLQAETPEQYGQPAIKKVYCRWVHTSAIAGQQATRLLNRYKQVPIEFKGRIEYDHATLKTGDQIELASDLCQGINGAAKSNVMQITSRNFTPADAVLDVTALTFLSAVGNGAFIAPTGTGDYTTTGRAANPTYSWIATTGGTMPNGDEPFNII